MPVLTVWSTPGAALLITSVSGVPIQQTIGVFVVTGLLIVAVGASGMFERLMNRIPAAITAAICMGREAHHDPGRRYTAAVAAGVFYVAIGLFGGAVAALFAAFPKELVMAVAGLALLGTIGNGLAAAARDEADREPALITFLVTASGVTLWSIGSAFWGLVAGALALGVKALLARPALRG